MGPAALDHEPTLKYTTWEWMRFSVAYGEHFLIALHHTITAEPIKCPFLKKLGAAIESLPISKKLSQRSCCLVSHVS